MRIISSEVIQIKTILSKQDSANTKKSSKKRVSFCETSSKYNECMSLSRKERCNLNSKLFVRNQKNRFK